MGSGNHKIEDRILLKRAIDEVSPKALGEIYQKYQPFIEKYIVQKVRSKDEGQDLVHTVFLRLCQGSCKYSGNSDVQGYLCGIAKKVLRDHFKAKKRQIRINTLEEVGIDKEQLTHLSHIEDPSGNLQKAETRQALKKAISQLPPKSRQAIELAYSHKENASATIPNADCSLETLRKRHEYAIYLLKKKFNKL